MGAVVEVYISFQVFSPSLPIASDLFKTKIENFKGRLLHERESLGCVWDKGAGC